MKVAVLLTIGLTLFVFGAFAGHTINATRALIHAGQAAPFAVMKNSKNPSVETVEPAF